LLSATGVKYIVSECETGLSLCDQLNAELGKPGNDAACSEIRRNKFLMSGKVKEAGISVPEQICSENIDIILNWTNQQNRWPLVCKPTESTGNDDVYFCHNKEELQKAFQKTMGKKNKLNRMNSKMLVQEFCSGAEFAVDTVSWQGHHTIKQLCGI
jgi:biotin carboxylase